MRTALCLIALTMAGMATAGCAQQSGLDTGSLGQAGAPAEVVNTPDSRLKHLAWNSAWAQVCGFYFDNAKLKSSYLAYEANSGTAPETVAKLATSYDKAQGIIRSGVSSRTDLCTETRLQRIRDSIARYLAGDFSPGGAA